ncbi:MAG: hypothetical protein IJY18_02995 [Clostridia bacterium]|nr:hypothetical protein [Clostridia bacterium]
MLNFIRLLLLKIAQSPSGDGMEIIVFNLVLRYVYCFYSEGELLITDAFTDRQEIENEPKRFLLHDQEDSTFIVSEVRRDFRGNYVVLTFPNKDNLIVAENDTVELAYDEYYSAMGDNNHNVYEGTITLEKI